MAHFWRPLLSSLITILSLVKSSYPSAVRHRSSSSIETTISVLLSSETITELDIGDTAEISISVDGEDVTEGYELSSSDDTIVTIEGNIIKSTGLGTAIITARSLEYDVQSTVTVDVVIPITKLTLSAEFSSIEVGGKDQMSYVTKPKDSSVTVNMIYESSDKSIATVDSSGIVTGISSGVVTIKGTDRITGISDSFDITVK